MNEAWQEFTRRAQARDANGNLCPLINDQQSEPELRALCRQFIEKCPCAGVQPKCPFRLLSKLSQSTINDWLAGMSVSELRELFAMELNCRTLAQRDGRVRARPRIVWLENETLLCDVFETLTRAWGREVDLVFFYDGDDAWRELSHHPPDLFLTDHRHPSMSGYEIILKLAKARAQFPIIWTSADAELDQVKMFAGLGLKISLLSKPFETKDFYDRLNELIGPGDHPGTAPPEVTPGKQQPGNTR